MSLWSRIKNIIHPDTHHQEIREELEFHLEMDQLNGRDRREARLRLGNVSGIAEETRAVGIVGWLESVLQDARYGVRQLRKSPAAMNLWSSQEGDLSGIRTARDPRNWTLISIIKIWRYQRIWILHRGSAHSPSMGRPVNTRCAARQGGHLRS